MPVLGLNVSDEAAAQLAAITERTGATRTHVLEEALRLYHERTVEPKLIVGYVQVDRPGDVDTDEPCPVCGESFESGMFIRLHESGTFSGPVCSRCATSE